MGKPNSKTVNLSGDPQVMIMNTLEAHSALHEDHDLKLSIILAAVVTQLLVTAYILWKKHTRRTALKAAKSVAALQQV